MTDHPITPPPELVQQWEADATISREAASSWTAAFATRAAQWGADMELEACLRLVEIDGGEDAYDFARYIRAARRPKPPALKELALEALDQADKGLNKSEWQQCSDTIRRALEALPD
jgi:hypothetical protein